MALIPITKENETDIASLQNPLVAVFHKNSGSHTANGSYQAVTVFTSTTEDSHSTVNLAAGSFTVPVGFDGLYRITINMSFQLSGAGQRGLKLLKGGADTGFGAAVEATSTSISCGLAVTGILRLIAGDVITADTYQNSGGSLLYATSADIISNICVERIGL